MLQAKEISVKEAPILAIINYGWCILLWPRCHGKFFTDSRKTQASNCSCSRNVKAHFSKFSNKAFPVPNTLTPKQRRAHLSSVRGFSEKRQNKLYVDEYWCPIPLNVFIHENTLPLENFMQWFVIGILFMKTRSTWTNEVVVIRANPLPPCSTSCVD